MADGTKIEWTDATWNPIGGCSIKSPGCINCYAQSLAGTRLARHSLYAGTTDIVKGKSVFNGHLTAAPDGAKVWTWPLHWRGSRFAEFEGRLSRIFLGDMSDLFHENRPLHDIIRSIAVALLCQHVVQILTKRADRLRAMMLDSEFVSAIEGAMDDIAPAHWHDREIDDRGGWPNPRLWLGFSAERQQEFDERWAFVRDLASAGWIIFVSVEPMLGAVVLPQDLLTLGRRVQVIVGGESGRDARPMHPDWARSIREQCSAAGVPFLFKQWGSWTSIVDRDRDDPDRRADYAVVNRVPGYRIVSLTGGSGFHGERVHLMRHVGKKAAGRLLDGRTWDQFPKVRDGQS